MEKKDSLAHGLGAVSGDPMVSAGVEAQCERCRGMTTGGGARPNLNSRHALLLGRATLPGHGPSRLTPATSCPFQGAPLNPLALAWRHQSLVSCLGLERGAWCSWS